MQCDSICMIYDTLHEKGKLLKPDLTSASIQSLCHE